MAGDGGVCTNGAASETVGRIRLRTGCRSMRHGSKTFRAKACEENQTGEKSASCATATSEYSETGIGCVGKTSGAYCTLMICA